jgi:hypothetical protein
MAEPVHLVEDGRVLVTLTSPPSVFRPNSALCGPRTNSTWLTSRSSMLEELELSCGTPSMLVVIDGFAGLDPMPRNRALLNFRAVKSLK